MLLRKEDYDIGLEIAGREKRVESFQRVCDDFPQSEFAPEALYYTAVGKYLSTGEVDRLMEGWNRLQRWYPATSWAYRSRV